MKKLTVKDILIEGKSRLENVGWCQGHDVIFKYNSDPPEIIGYCANGCINMINVDSKLLIKARNIISQIIFIAHNCDGIALWNDEKQRTKEEVLDVFDRAIKSVS